MIELGSIVQLIELGLGLEASNRPFIWVIREGNQLHELEKWIKEEEFFHLSLHFEVARSVCLKLMKWMECSYIIPPTLFVH